MNKEELIINFQELYAIEKKAHDYYEDLLKSDLNFHEKQVIQEIHDDEERHMDVANNIINIIKESL